VSQNFLSINSLLTDSLKSVLGSSVQKAIPWFWCLC